MAIIQGNWSKLLSPGLAKAFNAGDVFGDKYLAEVYESSPMPYTSFMRDSGPPVRELHVYDLGDGFLVPCQMVDDLFV